MIDYSKKPRPDKPEVYTLSRVILKIGREYWTVDLEQRLSEKRRLKKSELPPELQKDKKQEQETPEPSLSGG